MLQQEKSERSRTLILSAALRLFSKQGYRGTSIRDIADKAGISTGNLYHQFPDKERIFQTLLDQYWEEIRSPEFPFNKALAAGAFPADLEALAHAAHDSVERYRPYIALIYVDVVEFEGRHIRRFYQEMSSRFQVFLDLRPDLTAGLRPGVSPLSAVMIASRFFLYYYSVELIFGVPNHFGKENDAVVRDIVNIFEHGMLGNGARTCGAAREKRAEAPKRMPKVR
jgi:TetR/AcrR family transcriptional regulator, acrAB operon repressor